jgi:hypothetical protein
MPVGKRITAACHIRPESRQQFGQCLTIQHLEFKVSRVGLQTAHGFAGTFEFVGIQTDFHPPGSSITNILAGDFPHLCIQIGPGLRRCPGPLCVGWEIRALALHPDEAEITPRGAKSDIPLVQHEGRQAASLQTVGEGGAYQAATDHYGVMNTQGGDLSNLSH